MIRTFAILFLVLSLAVSPSLAETQRPHRIISLAPSTTEILFALGLDEEIVGVSLFCNYPQEASGKDKVGTFSQPNIEKILSLKPDIILCTGLEQADVITKMRQLGLEVHVSDPASFGELFSSIETIGRLVDRESEASALIGKMKDGIEGVRAATAAVPFGKRPKVFVEIWHTPLMTAGKGSFIDEMIELAGGINIAHDTPRPYSRLSAEMVIRLDPDLIMLAYMNKEGSVRSVERRFGWSGISAVRDHRVYDDIDPDLYLRPGPRLVEGLKEIQKKIESIK